LGYYCETYSVSVGNSCNNILVQFFLHDCITPKISFEFGIFAFLVYANPFSLNNDSNSKQFKTGSVVNFAIHFFFHMFLTTCFSGTHQLLFMVKNFSLEVWE